MRVWCPPAAGQVMSCCSCFSLVPPRIFMPPMSFYNSQVYSTVQYVRVFAFVCAGRAPRGLLALGAAAAEALPRGRDWQIKWIEGQEAEIYVRVQLLLSALIYYTRTINRLVNTVRVQCKLHWTLYTGTLFVSYSTCSGTLRVQSRRLYTIRTGMSHFSSGLRVRVLQ